MRARLQQGLAALLAACAGTVVLPVLAQDADLRVQHVIVSAGGDGIKRTTEFSERVVRRQDQVWIERIVPPGWHADHEHAAADKAHKHLDVALAARWLQRGKDGKPVLRLASAQDKVLVDIAPTDYANVGFDGSWTAAYHLIDPASLKKLKPVSTQGDLTTYTSKEKDRSLKVVWNNRLQYPVLVESANGPSSRKTMVQAARPAGAPPWNTTQGYQRKDYSDYLD
jgi:hypothetical protein